MFVTVSELILTREHLWGGPLEEGEPWIVEGESPRTEILRGGVCGRLTHYPSQWEERGCHARGGLHGHRGSDAGVHFTQRRGSGRDDVPGRPDLRSDLRPKSVVLEVGRKCR